MGCRGQVKIKDDCGNGSVYLYTHWGAEELKEDVALVLARGKRWDDCEYLARMIFDQMKGNDFGSTGFGIGTSEHGDIEELIMIDCENQQVSWWKIHTWEEDQDEEEDSEGWECCSFEEYIELHKAFIDECIAKNELFIKEEE
jgi:hypothetical protein